MTNPRFAQDREAVIEALDLASIDEPIVDIVSAFTELPYCFPLQSCYGHFVCVSEKDSHTLAPIPSGYTGSVRYRIAYIALCIENSCNGRLLLACLAKIHTLDPAYIQFGSADWFWERFLNSYILQVEPERHLSKDEAILEVKEAQHVQRVRDLFFENLRDLSGWDRDNHLNVESG